MKSDSIKTASLVCFLISLVVLTPGVTSGIDNFESLKVIKTVLPAYPRSIIYEGIYDGSAQVVIHVNEMGELKDVFLAAFTHPEFGRMAEEYIWKWTFQPAKLNGEPIPVIKSYNFRYEDKQGVYAGGMMVSVADKLNYGRFAKSKRIYSPSELDEIPLPIHMTTPEFPEEFRGQNIIAKATVIFYIDADGTTRMPHVTESSHDGFGQTALLAVKEWKFQPPMARGKPVAILARQEFKFSEKQ